MPNYISVVTGNVMTLSMWQMVVSILLACISILIAMIGWGLRWGFRTMIREVDLLTKQVEGLSITLAQTGVELASRNRMADDRNALLLRRTDRLEDKMDEIRSGYSTGIDDRLDAQAKEEKEP
jgi:hypothetical protein